MRAWLDRARDAVGDRPLVVVGTDTTPAEELHALGALLRGAIRVVPASAPSPEPPAPFPVSTVRGQSRDVFEHAVQDFAPALVRSARQVLAFLDACDPGREASLYGSLPLPTFLRAARTSWAQPAELCRGLERTTAAPALFRGLLSHTGGTWLSWPPSPERWSALKRAMEAPKLVLQDPGLSGGGNGTWIHAELESALQQLGSTPRKLRVGPFVEGEPWAVTALVTSEKVVVFPPTRQLLLDDAHAGDALAGSFPDTEGLRAESRQFGARLRGRGFYGPLSLGFILRADGHRVYHDLTPREDRGVAAFSRLMEQDGLRPLRALLHAPHPWTDAEVAELEADLDQAVAATPTWRWFLTCVLERDRSVDPPPPAGLWRFGPDGPRHVSPEGTLGDLDDSTALLAPSVPPGLSLRSGERLYLGDLYCTPGLGRILQERHGSQLAVALIRAFLG